MWRGVALFTIAVVSCSFAANQGTCAAGTTLYSQRAVYLNDGSTLQSPDETKSVTVRSESDPRKANGSHLVFTVNVGKKEFTTRLVGFNAEVLWSPDSAAFGVTATEGGGGIGYRAYLFFVSEDGIKRVDVSPLIERSFHSPGRCEVPVRPNTALVDWLHGSERILVAAEVVPVSICECKGAFQLYEVTVPDLRIAKTYSQHDAKQKFWRSLGCQLKGAVDVCSGPEPKK